MGKIITEIEAYSISGYGTIIDRNKCCTYKRIQDFYLQANGYEQNQLVDIVDIKLNIITFDVDVYMSNRAGNKNWEFQLYNYRGPIPKETIILETQYPLYNSGNIVLNISPNNINNILTNGFYSYREYYYYDWYKQNIPANIVSYTVITEFGPTQVFAKFGEYVYNEEVQQIGKLTFIAESSKNANKCRFWIQNPKYEIISHTEWIFLNKGKGTTTYNDYPPSLVLGNGYNGINIQYDVNYSLFYEFTDRDGTTRNGMTSFAMKQQSENIVRISE